MQYGEFSARVHHKLAGQRVPLSASIEVTSRCNLQCAHCYINLPANDLNAQRRELSAAEWCDLIDQMAARGCLWLLLTGGEPFIRPDFLDIYLHAKRQGILVSVFTNGTTITPSIADVLAEWPPFEMEITLYGATAATYQRVTGVAGAFERALRGIGLLLERGVTLNLKTVVLTLNQHELAAIETLAVKFGTAFRFDPVLNMRLDGKHTPATLRLSPDEVVALDLADPKRCAAWQDEFARLSGFQPHPERLYQCGAGLYSAHIDAYGQLSICLLARQQQYDLRSGTFDEAWDHFVPQVRAQTRQRVTPCQTCDLNALCGQCPGTAYTESGDAEQPVTYLCQIAHLRAQQFREVKGETVYG